MVVDDSVFMRKIISDIISEDSEFQVIATAKNGIEAVELNRKLKPDAITMDIEMPQMNGLEALRNIMREQPAPVIMLSSLTQDGATETIRALEWGAFDFVGKPSGSISLDLHKVKQLLLQKLHAAVRSNVRKTTMTEPAVYREAPRSTDLSIREAAEKLSKSSTEPVEQLVAIGTSTGGPRALQQVLTKLPAGFPAPIVIVQHMPPNFTNSLAQRLNSISMLNVSEAKEGEVLRNGCAYIAPGGYHMKIVRSTARSYKIELNKEDARNGHRPSADILFESLIEFKELKRYAVLMTGMGSDGAKGMLALKNSGAVSAIAEAEETCVVYGMPRAAVELGGVTDILPLYQIANKLEQLALR